MYIGIESFLLLSIKGYPRDKFCRHRLWGVMNQVIYLVIDAYFIQVVFHIKTLENPSKRHHQ